jgi:hypothetical protein
VTEGLTLSHLREFCIGVHVFDETPETVTRRLKDMGAMTADFQSEKMFDPD